jgi:hypothetical protein
MEETFLRIICTDPLDVKLSFEHLIVINLVEGF